jgi:hypothetical protein
MENQINSEPTFFEKYSDHITISVLSIIALLFIFTGVQLYFGYQESKKPSPFIEANQILGFNGTDIYFKRSEGLFREFVSAEDQQEALLEILRISKVFEPKRLFHAIRMLSNSENPGELYRKIMPAIEESGALNPKGAFNKKFLRKNLFKNTGMSAADAADFILYSLQSANIDEYDIENEYYDPYKWLDKQRVNYGDAAIDIGIIKTKYPAKKEYDTGIILASTRPETIARVVDLAQLLRSGIRIDSGVNFYASDRPISAEEDGILPLSLKAFNQLYSSGGQVEDVSSVNSKLDKSSRVGEGVKYLTDLSDKTGILLNMFKNIISYTDPEKLPAGHKLALHYPNYGIGEQRLLTEYLMAKDVLKTYGSRMIDTFRVTNSITFEKEHVLREFAARFILEIKGGKYGKKKNFDILLQSNNPFAERDKLILINAFTELLENQGIKDIAVNIDVSAFTNRDNIYNVHIEFLKLFEFKYRASKIVSERSIESLLYRTRDNGDYTNLIGTPPSLTSSDKDITGGSFKRFFDNFLR